MLKTTQILLPWFLAACLFLAAGATPIPAESFDALNAPAPIPASIVPTVFIKGTLSAEPESNVPTPNKLLNDAKAATSLSMLPTIEQLRTQISDLDHKAKFYLVQLQEPKGAKMGSQRLAELWRLYQELNSTRDGIKKLITYVIRRLNTMKAAASRSSGNPALQRKISEVIAEWTTEEKGFSK